MKITQFVQIPDQEIEVHIDGLTAVNAIMEGSEDWTPEQLVRRACNNFLAVLRAMPDDAIAAQPAPVRKIIADVLEAQTQRFRKDLPL